MIHVGPAGWSYADWEGVVYPRPRPRGFHPLSFLARYFDCVELNTTFYRDARPELAEHWLELVADRPAFRFTAKLARDLTHASRPVDGDAIWGRVREWREGIEPLERARRLAAVLLQFPHSFHREAASLERLELLAEMLADLPLVVEVRHRSWFEDEGLASLEKLRLSLAEIDLPASPDHPPADPPRIGPLGYLRLHGRNAAAWFDSRSGRDARYDYLYREDEVAEIVRRARRLATGRDTTFVVTNNHFSGKAVANALEILAELTGERPLAPAEVVHAFPRLAGRTRVEGQGQLFGP